VKPGRAEQIAGWLAIAVAVAAFAIAASVAFR
jgi:hypothetical protein